MAPGRREDQFLVQEGATHAVVVDRLRNADWVFVSSPLAKQDHCCAQRGHQMENQAKYINDQRLLDAANGGHVSLETMQDRPKKRQRVVSEDDGHHSSVERTNLTIAVFHQLSVSRKWWAKSEHDTNVGLASRFLMSFGRSGPPGPVAHGDFVKTVAFPVIKEMCRVVLLFLGPKTPQGNAATDARTSTFGRSDLRLLRSVRVQCFQLKPEIPHVTCSLGELSKKLKTTLLNKQRPGINVSQSTEKPNGETMRSSSHATHFTEVIGHHLSRCGSGATSCGTTPTFQQRQRKRPCCGTRHESAPSPKPTKHRRLSHDFRLAPCFGRR